MEWGLFLRYNNVMTRNGSQSVSPTTLSIESAILAIPRGKISTYGRIALSAGLPNGARQVVRVLHSRALVSSLPWHRVLAKGSRAGTARIALQGDGFGEQFSLLCAEGVEVSPDGTVDLDRFGVS
jgi:methylated-DNA-protein-cysteine methyltransferase-like protein